MNTNFEFSISPEPISYNFPSFASIEGQGAFSSFFKVDAKNFGGIYPAVFAQIFHDLWRPSLQDTDLDPFLIIYYFFLIISYFPIFEVLSFSLFESNLTLKFVIQFFYVANCLVVLFLRNPFTHNHRL